MVCVLEHSNYIFWGVQSCIWEINFLTGFYGFHKYINDKYVQWGKKKYLGESLKKRKKRVFLDKLFRILQNTPIWGVLRNTPRCIFIQILWGVLKSLQNTCPKLTNKRTYEHLITSLQNTSKQFKTKFLSIAQRLVK